MDVEVTYMMDTDEYIIEVNGGLLEHVTYEEVVELVAVLVEECGIPLEDVWPDEEEEV